jgi:hypothetical protein
MGELFAEELAPWRKAVQEGLTLEAFVTRGSDSRSPTTEWSLSVITTKPQVRQRARAHWRTFVQVALLISLFALGYLGTRWWLTAG